MGCAEKTIFRWLHGKVAQGCSGYRRYHFVADRPFMVLSFGDTIENIFDDAEPFPYNLEEDELKAEVRYSLGIEPYPKG